MAAPTASEILAANHDLSVVCDGCRLVVDMNWARRRIVQQGRGDVPVDQLMFRCPRCHKPGQARVRGDGDALVGRPALWPPA